MNVSAPSTAHVAAPRQAPPPPAPQKASGPAEGHDGDEASVKPSGGKGGQVNIKV